MKLSGWTKNGALFGLFVTLVPLISWGHAHMRKAYWILGTKERGGRSREWRVVERMGGSVLDPRDKGERRKIKGVESS